MLLLAQLASRQEQRSAGSAPAFLGDVLGSPNATASLVRKPAPGLTMNVTGASFGLATELASVTLTTSGSGPWRRYEHGAHRTTAFGSETIAFEKEGLEQFLTVEKQQGRRTWSWRVGTAMRPRLLGDGGVGFVDRKTGRVMDIALGKAVIYDSEGRDVTPEGARWSLRTSGRATTLALELDDSSLALPYTIDPIVYRTSATSNNANAAATSISVTIPSSVRDGDMLVAWIAIKSGTATITDAAGTWTSVHTTTVNSGALLRVATFRKRATSTDGNGSTAYTFNFSASVAAVAGISAWAGVDNTGTVSSAGSTQTNNSLTITLPA